MVEEAAGCGDLAAGEGQRSARASEARQARSEFGGAQVVGLGGNPIQVLRVEIAAIDVEFGLVRQRGLMSLAIFGNIITSWSWFGTNMLGVGLHSYGFTDAAFWALSAFVASQLVIIGFASLPLEKWRSFRKPAAL